MMYYSSYRPSDFVEPSSTVNTCTHKEAKGRLHSTRDKCSNIGDDPVACSNDIDCQFNVGPPQPVVSSATANCFYGSINGSPQSITQAECNLLCVLNPLCVFFMYTGTNQCSIYDNGCIDMVSSSSFDTGYYIYGYTPPASSPENSCTHTEVNGRNPVV